MLNQSRMNLGELSLDDIISALWFVFQTIKVMRYMGKNNSKASKR